VAPPKILHNLQLENRYTKPTVQLNQADDLTIRTAQFL